MLGDTNELIVGNRNLPMASGGLWTRAEGVQTEQNLPMGMKESTGIDFLSRTQDLSQCYIVANLRYLLLCPALGNTVTP